MFEKFGEFDSAEELNRAAEGQLEQGDLKALRELAKENGIDEGDVEDYIEGFSTSLTTSLTAALGRLEVECQGKQEDAKGNIMHVIKEQIKVDCIKDDDLCKLVMKKGKRVEGIYTAMYNHASKTKTGNIGVACGTDRQLSQIIKAYYTKGEKEATKMLQRFASR